MLADEFTATGISAQVRTGALTAVDAVTDVLKRIDERDRFVSAFVSVRGDAAGVEAESVDARTDLDTLVLAGVPIAVKENLAIAGESVSDGSEATAVAASADHEVVARLRAAGAVIVGRTAMPELGAWAVTDRPGQVTRNPWNLELAPGGSSGGSGAAVAAGMVPVAIGNDGLGSVRIPASCCGLFGIKPGLGLAPADVGVDSWGGMVENGPLTTTVADGALLLSVLAGKPELAAPPVPKQLRVGLAVGSPSPVIRIDRHWKAAARTGGAALAAAGHLVETTEFPYPRTPWVALSRWLAACARDAAEFDGARLQKRSRRHVEAGRLVNRFGLVGSAAGLEAAATAFFDGYDVVLTPALAQSPPSASEWSGKGWLPNIVASARYAPFAAIWNILGWPAASVPIGMHPDSGTPLAVQIAGPPESEATILGLAAQIEAQRPWERVATV